jgi:hypothetical protein
MMRRTVWLLGVLFSSTAAAAEWKDLATFLQEANASAAPAAIVRADGKVASETLEGRKEDRIALLVRPNKDVYAELRDRGLRALVRGDGAAAQVAEKGSSPSDFARDQILGATDFTREDLQPYDSSAYDSPTVLYRDAAQTTVQLNPLRSQYTLVVITFDSQKKVPTKILYYKDTLSNLVKMRLDSEHQQVAGRWFPGKVTMENFPFKTKTALELKWSEAGAGAEKLFAEGSLKEASALAGPPSE